MIFTGSVNRLTCVSVYLIITRLRNVNLLCFSDSIEGIHFLNCTLKCPVTLKMAKKSLFLLTVALLCFQAKKLPFSHGNCDSDKVVVPVQLPNNIPSGKHKRFMFLYLVVHNNSLQCRQLSCLASS